MQARSGETATGRESLVHTSVSLPLVILALESSTRRTFGRQFGADVQGTKTFARVEQIMPPAQQANVLPEPRLANGFT